MKDKEGENREGLGKGQGRKSINRKGQTPKGKRGGVGLLQSRQKKKTKKKIVVGWREIRRRPRKEIRKERKRNMFGKGKRASFMEVGGRIGKKRGHGVAGKQGGEKVKLKGQGAPVRKRKRKVNRGGWMSEKFKLISKEVRRKCSHFVATYDNWKRDT